MAVPPLSATKTADSSCGSGRAARTLEESLMGSPCRFLDLRVLRVCSVSEDLFLVMSGAVRGC